MLELLESEQKKKKKIDAIKYLDERLIITKPNIVEISQ